jgi:flavodoxin
MGGNTVKPLVVFYSRTGTTKKVGEALVDLLQCDNEELIDTKKRTGPLGFLQSERDAARNRLTVLEPLIHDPALYDVVALGTPVWNGLMSSPMRTYITNNKAKFNRVAFFCTQGGNENKKLFSDMQALVSPL